MGMLVSSQVQHLLAGLNLSIEKPFFRTIEKQYSCFVKKHPASFFCLELVKSSRRRTYQMDTIFNIHKAQKQQRE
jgi:hypothetical protein